MDETQSSSDIETARVVYVRPVSGAEILDQIGEDGPDIAPGDTLYAVHL